MIFSLFHSKYKSLFDLKLLSFGVLPRSYSKYKCIGNVIVKKWLIWMIRFLRMLILMICNRLMLSIMNNEWILTDRNRFRMQHYSISTFLVNLRQNICKFLRYTSYIWYITVIIFKLTLTKTAYFFIYTFNDSIKCIYWNIFLLRNAK